jgi:signal transduction histidine kinase
MTDAPVRVLLIEDDEDDAFLVAAELRRGGFADAHVHRVDTPEAFVAALGEPWDVILSDYRMPRFNAREALAILRESGEDVPFIVVSGTVGEDTAVEMMRAGANDYFRKENMARLGPAIAREIGEKRRRDEARALEEKLRAEEREARAEAEAASRLKDQFLATVSHELRTPLTAILGWAQMLSANMLDEATRKRAVETILRNARLQVHVVEALLDVSRMLNGEIQPSRAEVDPRGAILEALAAVRPSAEAKGIAIEASLDEVGRVRGDLARLRQVGENLLSNAVKFAPEGGRVDVALCESGDRVELRVHDNGQGIHADFLPHVFERFRQEDASTTRRHGGLGLGLFIVYYLVKLHGGEVRAESGGEGKGATFTVALPLAEKEAR